MKKISEIFAVVLCLAMVMAMLPLAVSAASENSVEFTVDTLELESQAYTASTNNVGGIGVEWIQLGNYGNGIQMRDKDGNTSMFWNTSAIPGNITKIEFTYNDAKKTYADNHMIVNFGKEAKGSDCKMTLTTIADTKSYTITPNGNYSFFYIEWDTGYSSYWDSIKVYYSGSAAGGNQGGNQGGNTQDPVTPPPAASVTVADGEYVIVCPAFNKALSSEKALNQDGSVGFYNAGVDVTVSGSTVTGYGDSEKWIIKNNADGTITISQNGKNLALADKFSSMNLGEVNDKWVVEDAGNGLYYIKNDARGNYIEWYNDMNNWSSYGTIGEGKENLFALQLVALNVQNPGQTPEQPGETPDVPSEPNQPTGDMSIAGLVIALTAATGCAVVLTKKKEF